MKKLIILLSLVFCSLTLIGQATPSKLVRIADKVTAFGTSLPVGTQIFVVSDSTLYVVKAAAISTLTVTTGMSGGKLAQIDRTDLSLDTLTDTTNIIRSNYGAGNAGTSVTLNKATTSYAGLMSASDKTKLDAISAGSGVMTSEAFELASDASAGAQVTLANTPKDSTGVTVSLNGVELVRTTQYYLGTLSVKKVTFKIPVYQYDAVNVSYTK